jgi:hypothetical protein
VGWCLPNTLSKVVSSDDGHDSLGIIWVCSLFFVIVFLMSTFPSLPNMPPQDDEADEYSHLLSPRVAALSGKQKSTKSNRHQLEDVESIISSHLSKDEQAFGHTAVGERLPYNDYQTIDWLHDLVRIC